MKRTILMTVMLLAIAATGFGQGGSAAPATPAAKLKVGDMAPDFTLSDTAGTKVKLSDLRGKSNVVLAFYIFAFTGGWTKELQAYQAGIAKFDAVSTKVFGISMDSRFSNKAFAEKIGITSFPLLSDWNRTVTKDYGLFNEAGGYGNRGTFVIDKEGKIRQIVLDNLAIDPSATLEQCSLMERKLVVDPPKQ